MSAVAFMVASHFAPGFNNQRMGQYDGLFIRRTWATLEQQRVFPGEIFALDKKFVEGRVPPVGGLCCQYHLAIAGQFQMPQMIAVI